MKEKSEAFLFFFNYASVLLVAILNFALAVREVSKSQPTNNDDIGWAIFISITVNSCVNTLEQKIKREKFPTGYGTVPSREQNLTRNTV